jgi:hypothetical protein
MNDLQLDFIDLTINKYENKNKKIEKLLIGRELYRELMANHEFAEEVINSALDPEERGYRGVKIKITNNEYELTFLVQD